MGTNQSIRTEWQLFKHLLTFGSDQLSEYELYKACVPDAIIGKIRNESLRLSHPYQQLLLARKLIFERDLVSSFKKLKTILREQTDSILQGDAYSLIGGVLHQKGHLTWSYQACERAEKFYLNTFEYHKYLRILINKKISLKSSEEQINSYFNGDLYFLKQECLSKQYYDLCANIEKSKCCEFISMGNFEGALTAANLASEHYLKDGSSNDGNVALILKALCYYCLGLKEEAISIRSTLQNSKGKYQHFLAVFDQIAQGKKPNLTKEHPLFGTPWPIYQFRKNSVVGLVHARLMDGPVSREELIQLVWGSDAIDPSYVVRLHTVITSLRNKYHINIEFDGGKYNLVSARKSTKHSSAL